MFKKERMGVNFIIQSEAKNIFSMLYTKRVDILRFALNDRHALSL